MSIEEDNKKLVTRYLDNISASKVEEAFSCVADDAVWIMPTSQETRLTKADVMNALRNLLAVTEDGIRIWPIAFTAEGERIAVQAESHARMKDGRIYANKYHLLMVIRDGLVKESYEYLDTLHVAQVLRNALHDPAAN